MAYTPDQVAQAIIAEGKRRGITERGIVIGLSTAIVESGDRVLANKADPDSLNYPNDGLSEDANSDGAFQQRDPWWGTVADRMDPTRSAGLFYAELAKLDYNSTAQTPGWYAQQVQKSEYPDRYDEHMADAQAQYNRLSGGVVTAPVDPNRPDYNEYWVESPNSQSRNGTKVDLWLLHTEEGDGNADELAHGVLGDPAPGGDPSKAVSYHYSISEDPNDHGVTVCDVVDTDLASWSVLDANNRSINLCFAGSYAAWTRDEWLANASRAIDVAAYLAVQDCRKYNIPLKVITPPYGPPGGVSDHRYVTEYLKDGTHTDVGGPMQPPWTGFPWDVFATAFNKYAGIGQPTTPPVVTPPVTPSGPTPVGPADDQLTLRWNCLGGQTLVEAVAEIRDKLFGTNDRPKEGAL